MTSLDATEIAQVEQLLKQHQIAYKRRLVNRNFHGFAQRTNLIGSVGEAADLQNRYYFYVDHKDAEEAGELLRRWRQGL